MRVYDYLQNNILITDGAMGTYYSEVTGDNSMACEFANTSNPEIVKKIHMNYIEAGAKLIRTNTFSANSFYLGVSRDKVKELIHAGFNIAKEVVADKDIFVAASIGPINNSTVDKNDEDTLEEYKFIVDP